MMEIPFYMITCNTDGVSMHLCVVSNDENVLPPAERQFLKIQKR